ncbi:transposable element Tcb2 transposase [Trichonephila clavipes]|nr:transposable element Tcb2 transposase [Trichonephila clavipes]
MFNKYRGAWSVHTPDSIVLGFMNLLNREELLISEKESIPAINCGPSQKFSAPSEPYELVFFHLSSDCRRQLIWRESGIAYRPENIQEKDRYPTCSIMVWGSIMINGRTRLHVVANGTMTGQRYIDEVLLPHVRLFRGAVGDKFVFMDYNATCHRTLAVQDCLDSESIQRLV